MERVPNISRDDVLRVIRRDYPAVAFAAVLSLLDRYGTETWERERDRVQLAALKLAAGSVAELGRQVEAAKRDYRDALAEAEFPESLACMSPCRLLQPREIEAMDARDWAQYRRWLTGA
jgi:hypothetical protein